MARIKRKLAPTKNLSKLNAAYEAIKEGGIVFGFGFPGLGKSWGLGSLHSREGGFLIEAKAGWTQRALLKALLREMGTSDPKGTNADMLERVIDQLCHWRDSQGIVKPLFFDEIDHYLGDRRSIETIRGIHDATDNPIVMIGMSGVPGTVGVEKQIKRYPQLADRIAEWTSFEAIDEEDLRTIATFCSDVTIGEDLLRRLHMDCEGNLRQIRLGIAKINKLAKSNNLQAIDLSQWGDKPFALRGVA